jgi:hypothetical protein
MFSRNIDLTLKLILKIIIMIFTKEKVLCLKLSSVARAEFDLREMERDKVNDFVVNGKINKLIKLLSNRGS